MRGEKADEAASGPNVPLKRETLNVFRNGRASATGEETEEESKDK